MVLPSKAESLAGPCIVRAQRSLCATSLNLTHFWLSKHRYHCMYQVQHFLNTIFYIPRYLLYIPLVFVDLY